MKTFTDQPLFTVHRWLSRQAAAMHPGEDVSFCVLNPDLFLHEYAGTRVQYKEQSYIHRPLQCYLDLAMQLGFIARVPQKKDHLLVFVFTRQDGTNSFHNHTVDKYGQNSPFFTLDKNEQASFLHYYLLALQQTKACKAVSVLNLGVHRGLEFAPLQQLCKQDFKQMALQGVDLNADALQEARQSYPGALFYEHDINDLASLPLHKSDLLISIGTLHSPGIDFDNVLRYVVKELLQKRAGIILGFPNCRWIDGQMVYGAKMKNYDFSEMSLVLKDMIFAKRYLQKKGFKVLTFGKDYLFVCAFRG
ncbi:MAG: methyltransferase [Campylobacterota bacterium]